MTAPPRWCGPARGRARCGCRGRRPASPLTASTSATVQVPPHRCPRRSVGARPLPRAGSFLPRPARSASPTGPTAPARTAPRARRRPRRTIRAAPEARPHQPGPAANTDHGVAPPAPARAIARLAPSPARSPASFAVSGRRPTRPPAAHTGTARRSGARTAPPGADAPPPAPLARRPPSRDAQAAAPHRRAARNTAGAAHPIALRRPARTAPRPRPAPIPATRPAPRRADPTPAEATWQAIAVPPPGRARTGPRPPTQPGPRARSRCRG